MIQRSPPATLDDLYQVEGKAELINGRIVPIMPSGDLPSLVAFEIAVLLREYTRSTGRGMAYADGIGFAIVPPLLSGRQSFSPDASLYIGDHPADRMLFIEGAPAFAVEVRSAGDYGRAAEAEMQAKRADYFEAGTKVVWDVDPLARTIASYRHDRPDAPTVFHAGERANSEPALPGWSILVDEVFPSP
jgi:Uma2 family endonuclease